MLQKANLESLSMQGYNVCSFCRKNITFTVHLENIHKKWYLCNSSQIYFDLNQYNISLFNNSHNIQWCSPYVHQKKKHPTINKTKPAVHSMPGVCAACQGLHHTASTGHCTPGARLSPEHGAQRQQLPGTHSAAGCLAD